jgi:hypothetical protein
VKFAYLPDQAKAPQVSLAGGVVRPHPVIAVGLFSSQRDCLVDGLLDTGADDIVFPMSVATQLGLDVSQAPSQAIHLVGRGQPFKAYYVPLELRLTDGVEVYQWSALVGFVTLPFRRGLLGYAGFLQFFDAEFRGADREVILTPNRSFPGQIS